MYFSLRSIFCTTLSCQTSFPVAVLIPSAIRSVTI